jgi:hypothetical protein
MMQPCKIKSCHCEQCRHVKSKRKHRILKKFIKRFLNKKRRNPQNDGKVINYYWA